MAAVAIDSSSIAAPLPTRFYLPELDAIRFFAFAAVFIHHLRDQGLYDPAPYPRLLTEIAHFGSFGVDLFFALSAYLITELLMREKDFTGRIDIGSFYIRRGLRIWPLYFGFVGIAALLNSWAGHRVAMVSVSWTVR
jgi:peptidoglycan/LPS O-acetylase OafA/YrhL